MKIFLDEKVNMVSCLDEHWYGSNTVPDVWYPSVTLILDAYYKGHGIVDFYKSNGYNADIIIERAGTLGSNVHDACDQILQGRELKWFDVDGKPNYTYPEWEMICRFDDFLKRFRPEVLKNEFRLVSDEIRTGGTVDFVCRINGLLYLVDIKTGNNLYKSHYIQIATYKEMWDKYNPDFKIERTAILHLNAATKTEGKSGDIQGKGWILRESKLAHEHLMKLWYSCYLMWTEENPNAKPKNLTYQNTICYDNSNHS